jgi:hypothetical protein
MPAGTAPVCPIIARHRWIYTDPQFAQIAEQETRMSDALDHILRQAEKGNFMSREITGKMLIEWGYEPGRWFSQAIEAAERARQSGQDENEIRTIVDGLASPPAIPLRDSGELDHHMRFHWSTITGRCVTQKPPPRSSTS